MAALQDREGYVPLSWLKRTANRPNFQGLLVAVVASILIVLGFLQVHWSQEVSHAERQRLRGGLRVSIQRFNRDLSSQLTSLCRAFQTPAAKSPKLALDDIVDHYGDWRRISRRPDLLKSVGVWDAQRAEYQRLNPATSRFEKEPLPNQLQNLAVSPLASHPAFLALSTVRNGGSLWEFDEKGLVFIRRLETVPAAAAQGSQSKARNLFLVLELNHPYLAKVMLPEFVRRYFSGAGGLVYRIEIRQGAGPQQVLYQNPSNMPAADFAPPDAVMTLFHDIHPPTTAARTLQGDDADGVIHNPEDEESASNTEFFASEWQPVIIPVNTSQEWIMAVKHRSGSLDKAVEELQRRNLAVGFGVLLLLAASLALILVAVRRAHLLAQLQMDFAAGVSHDLRTPLAIICSAADNLADGVVTSGPQVKDYGALIRNEGARLSSMVDQVLAFVAQESGRVRYDLQPLEIEGFIEQVLDGSRAVLESSGLHVEKHIPPDLPLVRADRVALAQCVQNLISNAAKYGAAGGWMGLRAEDRKTAHGEEIQLTVEDRGPGIAAADLPHIFEPFYRGQMAYSTQARGTGIGLGLAKDIAAAMGGSLTVRSEPGKGCAFTLHLPAMDKGEQVLAEPA
ncbi:MAG TPA: HAMP domain-containing sensor histidine kinase [Terriglobia bacterium]|nr:HAMP domain-containing sensor histidine kinase [Terriglobia bacterium]